MSRLYSLVILLLGLPSTLDGRRLAPEQTESTVRPPAVYRA
jgi:hypothetical protein